MTIGALIVAGGSSKRFANKMPKQFHTVNGDTVINHSIKKFLKIKKISKIIIAVDKKIYTKYRHLVLVNKKIKITNAGKTRALSVWNGLKAAKNINISKILIHDAARPYFSIKIINKQIKYLKKCDAIIPAIASDDSIVFKKNSIPREEVFKIQTPQAFDLKSIYKLHLLNKDKNIPDDSSLFFKNKVPVKLIEGNFENKKITYAQDIAIKNFYGIGYDIHKMIKGRKLIVGGVTIPSTMGPMGHSDGDSLLHALIDSFLGAIKKGDIGTLFPNIGKYKDIKSTKLLKKIIQILNKNNFKIEGIDLNIILQSPNLGKYKEKIKNNLSKLCKIHKDKINIKAKTTDRLGIIGQNKALACEVISVLNYA
jgi:2-C-methyl-D-erythritol 4-phosphate cytidylyltransferase/2-C-methyl-D-erythritol 2,4-cyclodiphosphate synthase